MLRKLIKKEDVPAAELEAFERLLNASLTPVAAPSEFVSKLRNQLLWSDIPEHIPTPAVRLPRAVLLLGGVVGSILVLMTSIRGLVSLLGVIGLIRQQVRRSQPHKTAAAT